MDCSGRGSVLRCRNLWPQVSVENLRLNVPSSPKLPKRVRYIRRTKVSSEDFWGEECLGRRRWYVYLTICLSLQIKCRSRNDDGLTTGKKQTSYPDQSITKMQIILHITPTTLEPRHMAGRRSKERVKRWHSVKRHGGHSLTVFPPFSKQWAPPIGNAHLIRKNDCLEMCRFVGKNEYVPFEVYASWGINPFFPPWSRFQWLSFQGQRAIPLFLRIDWLMCVSDNVSETATAATRVCFQ